MSQQVITTTESALPLRRRSSLVALALAALLGATLTFVAVRVVSSESSIEPRSATRPVTASVTPAVTPLASAPTSSSACTAPAHLDGAHLLSVVTAMPRATATQLVASLSTQTRQTVEQAAMTTVIANRGAVPAPDGIDLWGVLTRVNASDRQLILTALPANVRGTIGLQFDPMSLPVEFHAAFANAAPSIPTCG